MALLNSGTLVRTFALYHIIIAFFLLSSPTTLANHPLVSILGASMRIPSATSFSNTPPANPSSHTSSPLRTSSIATDAGVLVPSPGLALAAMFLAILGIADFMTEVLPDVAYSTYWFAQTTVRLPVFFLICAWVYLFKPLEDPLRMGAWGDAGWGGSAKNSLVFTLGFVEVIWLFWMFSTLREEKVKGVSANTDQQNNGVKEQ